MLADYSVRHKDCKQASRMLTPMLLAQNFLLDVITT
jgi:hypothetical protein